MIVGLINELIKPVKFLTESPFLHFCLIYIIETAVLQFSHSYGSAVFSGIIILLLLLMQKRSLSVLMITISAVLLSFISSFLSFHRITQNEVEFKKFVESTNDYEIFINSDPEFDHFSTDYPVEAGNGANKSRFFIRTTRFPRYLISAQCVIKDNEIKPKEISENYSGYLERNGIAGILEVDDLDCEKGRSSGMMINFRRLIYQLKVNSTRYIQSYLLEPKASLLLGMIYGDDRLFTAEFENDLRTTGTTHIIAASGFNVTVLYLMVERILGGIIPFKIRVSLTILLVIAFAFSANLSGSILRATITMFLMLISKVCGRMITTLEALLISVFLIVLFSPARVADVGLLLSSAAMVGLIIVMPVLSRLGSIVLRSYKLVGKYIEDNLFSTLSCTIGTLPVSNVFFGTGSLISIFPNLLLLPLVEYIYYLGVLVLLSSITDMTFLVNMIIPSLEILLGIFITIIRISANFIEGMDWINKYQTRFLFFSGIMLVVGYFYLIKNSRFSRYGG